LINLRKIFFSYRSFTPVPIVLILLYFTEPRYPFIWIGILSIILGENIRLYAVSYAGGATRTRKVGAPSLCTSGPYSYIRNPLYIGNIVIYIGFIFIGGGAFMWELLLTVFVFFCIQYSMIISLEEETLTDLFGPEYNHYKNNVPRFIPRTTAWNGSDNRIRLSIKKTIITEKRTIQNIIALIIFILLRTYLGNVNFQEIL